MALFKCKMCGGSLEVNNETVATCEYCGTPQTLPKLEDDRRANLYDRANHFRRNNEFDKAMSIYEKILNDDTTDAEAYWSLVLCRYGIEYVEDPASRKRIPTVNRTQYTSVFDDDNYKSALQYADAAQKAVYEEEARAINEIQKGILAISQQEDPFDVFICYKETDANGRRTHDSVLANDLYHQLTQEGFKVFFARITLEDKLGSAYEPYIFAALNSAKVMVVLGTKPEFFSAVWVKNEWSRYLSLIKQGQKKILIPAYRDMDPYDLPEEFSHLQAQDMGKLGFMQDLIRGIKKITQVEEPPVQTTVVKETVVSSASGNAAPLIKRAFIFLEDGDWSSADEYCEKVLDIDPENPMAYLGKLMAELQVRKQESLKDCAEPFDGRNSYQKVLRYADADLKTALTGYIDHILYRNEQTRLNGIYARAEDIMNSAKKEQQYLEAAKIFRSIAKHKDAKELAEKCKELAKEIAYQQACVTMQKAAFAETLRKAAAEFESLGDYKDAKEQARRCREKADDLNKDAVLSSAKAKMSSNNIRSCADALKQLESISGWKDADQKAEECKKKIAELEALETQKRIAQEQEREQKRKLDKRNKIIKISIITTIILAVIFVLLYKFVLVPNQKYNQAMELIDEGKYVKAYETLIAIDGYKDSAEQAESIYFEYQKEILKTAEVGDTVYFGKYEQDGDVDNGKEAIEWIVLDEKDGRLLVISKYALDCKPYNTVKTDVTWETCSLRLWLNNSFIAAFTNQERAMIPKVTVTADENPDYDTDPGNDTQDRVFLLSIVEAEKYFDSNGERKCESTEYADDKGAHSGFCWWWLRSPGFNQSYAAYVSNGGYEGGDTVNYGNYAVRPAMWIEIED